MDKNSLKHNILLHKAFSFARYGSVDIIKYILWLTEKYKLIIVVYREEKEKNNAYDST